MAQSIEKQIAAAVKAERTRVLDLVKASATAEDANVAYCKNGRKAVKAAHASLVKSIRTPAA